MTITIHTPEQSESGEMRALSAHIESNALPEPARMSFEISSEHGLAFSSNCDAFLVSMLAVAMKLGEDIRVDGSVSERLLYGIDSYQDVITTWFGDSFSKVDIVAEHVNSRSNELRPAGVGCCFSGGVDSFSAVKDLCPPQNRFTGFAISHALMINGFDQIVDLEEQGMMKRLETIYTSALDQWGVKLVVIKTNQGSIRQPHLTRAEQIQSYGAALTACAHALAPVFGRFNLGGHASYAYEDIVPKGSHALMDHMLSTDQLEVAHLGAKYSRSEKVEHIADELAVQGSLRVCFLPPEFDPNNGDVLNCCNCEKCVRTIAMLDIIGKLERFRTFRYRGHITVYKNPQLLANIPNLYLDDLIEQAKRNDRADWSMALEQARKIEVQGKVHV